MFLRWAATLCRFSTTEGFSIQSGRYGNKWSMGRLVSRAFFFPSKWKLLSHRRLSQGPPAPTQLNLLGREYVPFERFFSTTRVLRVDSGCPVTTKKPKPAHSRKQRAPHTRPFFDL